MKSTPLTGGMASLGQAEDNLTRCACWEVKFDHFHPKIVVAPYDTNLDEIEAIGRRAILEASTSPTASVTVACMSVVRVSRLPDVVLSPRYVPGPDDPSHPDPFSTHTLRRG